MAEDTKLKIGFGRQSFPNDVCAVWGARLIWPDDLLHDRQDLDARSDEDKLALMDWLNGTGSGNGAIAKMREALKSPYSLGLSRDMAFEDEAIIYEDDKGKIVGSAQGSSGYLYVAGWLKEHTSDGHA